MRTATGVQERAESALDRRQFVRSANDHLGRWELAFLLPTPHDADCCHVRTLSGPGQNPRLSDGRAQEAACTGTLNTDRTLQQLVADLVAARRAAAMPQEEVAARMWTTKSVVS